MTRELRRDGTAALREPYPLAADTLGPEEMSAVLSVLESRQLTMADRVRDFEERFAAWVGAQHAVMVNSGSSANLLMVDTLLRGTTRMRRLQMGDEVIVPGLAWPTTVWPVTQLGLVPVFVDVDPMTLAIDLESARSAIGPRTRAMFLIHPLGRAADLRRFKAFCEQHDLVLLEDCCESLGAHCDATHVGTTGIAGSFSFYFSHHISTIEGGMVITDEPGLADDLRGLRAHGWVRDRADQARWIADNPGFDPRFLFATLGYNVRPTELQAAIGIVQLGRLDTMIQARDALARQVRGWLVADVPWLELIGAETLEADTSVPRRKRANSWMTLPLRLLPTAPLTRQQVTAHLERRGVETRTIIAGNLARHPAVAAISHRTANDLAVCDSLLRDSFMIGCHPVASAASLETLRQAIISLSEIPR